MLMYTHKLCVKCNLLEFFDCLDCEFEFSQHLGKFAPRENNPLYSMCVCTIPD